MTAISFAVPGCPIAQPRHRIGAARFGGGRACAYIPSDHKIHGFKAAVQRAAQLAMAGRLPFAGPVSLTTTFILPRPKAFGPGPRRWMDRRPDLDNLAKGVKDAMTRAGVWDDDSQVVLMTLSKQYAAAGAEAYVDVCACEIREDPRP